MQKSRRSIEVTVARREAKTSRASVLPRRPDKLQMRCLRQSRLIVCLMHLLLHRRNLAVISGHQPSAKDRGHEIHSPKDLLGRTLAPTGANSDRRLRFLSSNQVLFLVNIASALDDNVTSTQRKATSCAPSNRVPGHCFIDFQTLLLPDFVRARKGKVKFPHGPSTYSRKNLTTT